MPFLHCERIGNSRRHVKIHNVDQTHLKLFLEYLAMLTLKIVVNVIVATFLLMFIFGLLNSDPSRNPNQRDLE